MKLDPLIHDPLPALYTARDLSAQVGELAALKGDAAHWPTDPAYAALPHRLENAHSAAEAALVEARCGVRLNE